jgi:KDO2-lipid IV(A) lauroyltransferase
VAERLPQGRGWRVHVEAFADAPTPAALNAGMERLVRRFPEQYLWGYNRYKQPAGAPPPTPARPNPPQSLGPLKPLTRHHRRPRHRPTHDRRFFPGSHSAFWRAISTLPYPVVSWLGLGLGTLLWWFATPRRRVTLTNLRRCLPELSEAQRRAIAREHFACFGRTLSNGSSSGPPVPRNASAVWCAWKAWRDWRSQTERPVILMAPHFLGLDAGGLRIQLETRFVSMYAKQKNPVLDEAMRRAAVASMRRCCCRVRMGCARPCAPCARESRSISCPTWIWVRATPSLYLFGIPAATVTTLARLARLTGAVVVPVLHDARRPRVCHRFDQPWEDFPGDDDTVAAARMNAYIETQVRQCPAQYLWSHKRFKTQPPGAPPVYQRIMSDGLAIL